MATTISGKTRVAANEAASGASGRDALKLAPDKTQTLQAMMAPSGAIFSAWTAFHLGLWAAGVFAVWVLPEWPVAQLAVSLFLGNQLHTLTILQHDCGHRSAYRSKGANLWIGRALAWFIFMPFNTFTEVHRWHHGYLGDASRDPDEWFYAGGHGQLYLRECLFMPRFIFLSLKQSAAPEIRGKVVRELLFNCATYALLAAGLATLGAWDVLVFAFVLPMLFLAALYNPISRGYEHHPLAAMEADDPRRHDLRHNTVTVTSPVIGFLWANITYHVEHHMYPRVPFYRLPKLHRMFAGKQYLTAPYPLHRLADAVEQPEPVQPVPSIPSI